MNQALHSHIQYTLLDPLVIDNQIDAAAQLAVPLQVGALCVPPYWVKKASRETAGTPVQLITVIGYPLGYQRTEAKIAEAELAFADGADSIELVLNLSAFKSRRMNWIKAEIARFSHLVHAREATFTIQMDGLRLDKEEEEILCTTSADAGADYICLSPAFSSGSVTPAYISHLRNLVPSSVGIKTWVERSHFAQIQEFVEAGADLVCVSSVDFISEKV